MRKLATKIRTLEEKRLCQVVDAIHECYQTRHTRASMHALQYTAYYHELLARCWYNNVGHNDEESEKQ